jgi:formylglycine-generating enzyme required for sulfatase activity
MAMTGAGRHLGFDFKRAIDWLQRARAVPALVVSVFGLTTAPVSHAETEPVRLSLQYDRGAGMFAIEAQLLEGSLCQLEESQDLVSWKVWAAKGAEDGTVRFEIPSPTGSAFFRLQVLAVRPLASMVWIEPGECLLSSPPDEEGRFLDKEDPQTTIQLTRGYWICRYEVTQAEFQTVMNSNPSLFRGEPRRPVENVNWFQAVEYCARLTEREQADGNLPLNYAYRLPTEAEWAYAARAGTTTRFSYGDDPGYTQLRNYAWYSGNSGLRPHPVGEKLPNPWGLYDMHGNVFEWCSDWFDDLPGGFQIDPIGPNSGIDRIIRGGYWDSGPDFCRSALRVHYPPETNISYLGFRVALSEVRLPEL